jgi:hypothetical protein
MLAGKKAMAFCGQSFYQLKCMQKTIISPPCKMYEHLSWAWELGPKTSNLLPIPSPTTRGQAWTENLWSWRMRVKGVYFITQDREKWRILFDLSPPRAGQELAFFLTRSHIISGKLGATYHLFPYFISACTRSMCDLLAVIP